MDPADGRGDRFQEVVQSGRKETAMQTFSDAMSPRQQLSFEQLPRGFVKFPDHIVESTRREQQKRGFSDEFARDSVVRNTLRWYYDGLPTAYRELEDGIEVLALGFEETGPYVLNPQEGVKVVQP